MSTYETNIKLKKLEKFIGIWIKPKMKKQKKSNFVLARLG